MTPASSATFAAVCAFVSVIIASYLHNQVREQERAALIEDGKQRAFDAGRFGRCYEQCGSKPVEVFAARNNPLVAFKCLCNDNRVVEMAEIK